MGNPGCLSVVLPLDVGAAFSQIGNCISVQHALLCVCIGLVAASVRDIPVRSTVLRSFSNRVRPETSHVFHNAEFVWISSEHNTASDVIQCWPRDVKKSAGVQTDAALLPIDVRSTIAEAFQVLQWDQKQLARFHCHSGDDMIPLNTVVEQLIGMNIRVSCNGFLIFSGRLIFDDTMAVPTIIDLTVDDEDCLGILDPSIDNAPATSVAIFHFPDGPPSFLMCQTKSIISEVHALVSRHVNRQVQIFPMKNVFGYSCDMCVLAVHCHIPDSHVCVVWVDAVLGTATTESISRAGCSDSFIDHGQCFMKQQERSLPSVLAPKWEAMR